MYEIANLRVERRAENHAKLTAFLLQALTSSAFPLGIADFINMDGSRIINEICHDRRATLVRSTLR